MHIMRDTKEPVTYDELWEKAKIFQIIRSKTYMKHVVQALREHGYLKAVPQPKGENFKFIVNEKNAKASQVFSKNSSTNRLGWNANK